MNQPEWTKTMRNERLTCTLICLSMVAVFFAVAGCEGIDRKHDSRVADVTPPPDNAPGYVQERTAFPNVADVVEEMMARRQAYLEQLMAVERAYLVVSDVTKSNWARRQRELTEAVEVYPYLTAGAPELRAEVSPERQIPEADMLYADALKLFKEVHAIPLAGTLPANKQKARQALQMFKKLLREYPKSDKVGECAFYCGEIYKEYLREDDPDDEMSVRYYRWAVALNPRLPLPARFQCAVVYDFRRHDRVRALELYNQVLETDEAGNESNARFSATRIEQLTDDTRSHLNPDIKPVEPKAASAEPDNP